MTTQMNGASKRAVSPQRVLVTGGSSVVGQRAATGGGIPVHIPPKPGEMQAVIAGISAARAPGHAPTHDPESGLFTVWPEFSEAKK
jgi:hypothetical protein